MAKILITGGSGLVGTHLSRLLSKSGHEVVHLSRAVDAKAEFKTFKWDIDSQYIDEKAFDNLDHIIHLAGAGVAEKRWTKNRKQLIIDSRVKSLKLIRDYVVNLHLHLKSLVSASAIGYYGLDTGATELSEESPAGTDFLAHVVKLWEAEINSFEQFTKVAAVRIGVVLSEEGGALTQMALPVKFNLGAPLGSGDQYLSWIHITDLCRIFQYILEQNLTGPYNAAAPYPETNEALTKALAKSMKKPLFLPNVPAFIMKILLGEMAEMVLGGNYVSSQKIRNKGFDFTFAQLDAAIKDLLG